MGTPPAYTPLFLVLIIIIIIIHNNNYYFVVVFVVVVVVVVLQKLRELESGLRAEGSGAATNLSSLSFGLVG